ncbi:hypothetical protein [Cohnella fermenti]|uniref:Uncharacterized protein n=1 Tax=Cohnella fermenti TaxID=2565925 RepID=A0A4S4BXQ8_9BACL|nr:hypothetical protein [Cohnella fermenti]THF79916.1 hypothetical protein E6C55_11325 [Cohnella fermenti]
MTADFIRKITLAQLDDGEVGRFYTKISIHGDKSGSSWRMYAKNHIKRRDSPSIQVDECEKSYKIAKAAGSDRRRVFPAHSSPERAEEEA